MAGQVYSFESNSLHMRAAVHNYEQWCSNWALSHHTTLPDNVKFINADLSDVGKHLKAPVDAVSSYGVEGQGFVGYGCPFNFN